MVASLRALQSPVSPIEETVVSSAATVDLGAIATRGVLITGAVAITSLGSRAYGEYRLRFASALTLTHNAASLALPGGASIVTAAGDTCIASSDANGNWTIRDYRRATQTPVVVPGSAWTLFTPTISAATGTITAFSGNTGRYQMTGKLVHIQARVQLTTASNTIVGLTLPFTSNGLFPFHGVNSSGNLAIHGVLNAGSNILYAVKPDGSGLNSGDNLTLTGFYEAQ